MLEPQRFGSVIPKRLGEKAGDGWRSMTFADLAADAAKPYIVTFENGKLTEFQQIPFGGPIP